jgi:hypothetical protein
MLSKFGLKIAESKSSAIEFGRLEWEKARREGKKMATFDFLGFTHYCDKTRGGIFKLGRKTSGKKFRQEMKAVNHWLKGVRNLFKLMDRTLSLLRTQREHTKDYGGSITRFLVPKPEEEPRLCSAL